MRLLFRKMCTAVRIYREKGIRGVMRVACARMREARWTWRQRRILSHVRGSDYMLVPDVNGFAMLVSSNQLGIGPELAIYHVHEPITTKLIQGFVNEGDVVLDIGANIGYYSLLLSRLVGDDGLVIAVEPDPMNMDLLKLNLRINRIANVQTVHAAISDCEATALLFLSNRANWHSLKPTSHATGRTIEVRTTTIDALVSKMAVHVALIRMDIEGHEWQALRGAAQTLQRYKPHLVIEVHAAYLGCDATRDMLSWLAGLGYESQLLVLRGDDSPWWQHRRRVWKRSLESIMHDNKLLQEEGCFILMLE